MKLGLKRDPSSLPSMKRGEPLPPDSLAVLDLLRVLLKSAAGRHGVAPKLIATADELEKIARNDNADLPSLNGWRRELFGADAQAICQGKLGLAVENGQVVTFEKNTGIKSFHETPTVTESDDTMAMKPADS